MHIMRKIEYLNIDLFLYFSDTETWSLGPAALKICSLNRLEAYLGTPLMCKGTLQVGTITDRRLQTLIKLLPAKTS